MTTIGNLHDLRAEVVVNFEWKIKDFLQLSDKVDIFYKSPEFSFCGESWVIWIYPNGKTFNKTVGFISVYIGPNSLAAPISVNYSFHLETVDGKTDTDAKYSNTAVFDKANVGHGCHRLISISKLMERKSELLPSGVLTVICTLKKSGTNDGADKSGSASVDEFSQTEKETGFHKLQQHFKEILENGNLSDVVLKVENKEFKSHRCVLARSPVFLAMMTHEMKEKNTGVVDIQDIDSNTLSDFLRYLYTGSDDIITSGNVMKLYTAADKYQVDDLKKSCLDYMLSNVSVDNFCDVLSLSLEYVEKDLTDACIQFFTENSVAIISTAMWLTFLMKNPVAGNELYLKHLKNIMKDKK